MRGKTVAIVQSNYIPWKGYFDLINMADEFILYDDVQYTKNDWRNRNKIKTPTGVQWLTVPVLTKGRFGQRICDVQTRDTAWPRTHWKTIAQNYQRAPYFATYAPAIERLYAECTDVFLSRVNRRFLAALCDTLGIDTTLHWSMDFAVTGDRSERLVQLCRAVGGEHYLSGPAAKAYLDEGVFAQAGITVSYMDYAGYPEYPQLHGAFEHGVSVIDLLFNVGPEAHRFMKSFNA